MIYYDLSCSQIIRNIDEFARLYKSKVTSGPKSLAQSPIHVGKSVSLI